MSDKQTQALKLALEALVKTDAEPGSKAWEREAEAMIAIRKALAEESSGTEQPKESPKFDPNESFAREEAAQARVREFMRNH